MQRLAKPNLRSLGLIALFWIVFWAAYPYRGLIDDSRFESILRHKFLFIDTFMRPIHSWFLYVVGETGASMSTAAFLNILIHLGTGAVANWKLIPRMPEPMRVPARLGLIAFLVHPVSIQTAVHVAQGSEIIGMFVTALTLTFAMKFIPDPRITGKAAPRKLMPKKSDFYWLAGGALLALLSKENYFPPLLLMIAGLAWFHRSRAGRNVLFILVPMLAVGALSNSFSREVIQNQTNYQRSRSFRQAVAEGRQVSPEDSIILPLRDRGENFVLQVSLVPQITRVILVPFGLVKDYGHFPYGKDTYQGLKWQFWLGLAMGIALLASLGLWWRKTTPAVWALLLSPFAYYAVYYVFVIYDPLFLYRLYGAVFFSFVLTIPALTQLGAPNPNRDRKIQIFAAAVACVSVAGGIIRAYEMRNPVVETTLELEREPYQYRHHVARLHALVETKRFPIDCRAELEPALALAPSAALIYVEWAWCHSVQRQLPEAREKAMQSLEYESVPENVKFAMNYLITPEGFTFDQKKIHPSNLPVLFAKPGP